VLGLLPLTGRYVHHARYVSCGMSINNFVLLIKCITKIVRSKGVSSPKCLFEPSDKRTAGLKNMQTIELTAKYIGRASLCSASYVGCQRDTARICC